MGCACMKAKSGCKETALLAAQTCFSVTEVEALHELFRKLSSSLVDDGLISKEEFQLGILRNSKKHSLFTDRIFCLFDSNHDGFIDFKEDKVLFAFHLYDIWQTGFIERQEVKEMILALLSESDLILPEDIVEAIIDKTFDEADSKGDGKIDLEEWKDFVGRNPSLLKNMTVPYLKDIRSTFPSFVLHP